MGAIVRLLDRLFYPEIKHRQWPSVRFRELLEEYLDVEQTVLDLGAGRGKVKAMDLRGRVKRVCGIDPDKRVTENPALDEGVVGFGDRIPYDDGMFDLVFSSYVMEHIENPAAVFSEVARVLKDGGYFIFHTPNRRHYVPLIASITPQSFHNFIGKKRDNESDDLFPTFYRVNTPGDVRKYAGETGFEVLGIELSEGRPEYLRISPFLYPFGIAYQRAVTLIPFLARFRVDMFVVLRKK